MSVQLHAAIDRAVGAMVDHIRAGVESKCPLMPWTDEVHDAVFGALYAMSGEELHALALRMDRTPGAHP